MKIKTNELTRAALDWAVATAIGYTEIRVFGRSRPSDRGWVEVRSNPEPKAATARFDPSEDWSQGGPIIESEMIRIEPSATHSGWFAVTDPGCYAIPSERHYADGPTPLIAAMRCYVSSKLGDEVEIPDALIP